MRRTSMTDVVDCMRYEASQLRDFMAHLSPEAWARPSACPGWTVGDVFAHLTQGAHTWSAAITRAMAGDATPPPGQQPLRPGERGSAATAQRAIAFCQEMGAAGLLDAFATGSQQLHQLLVGRQADDWDKPCFHRRGVLPIGDYVDIRLQELALHGWDIRSAFDATATVSERPFPVLVHIARRWLSNTFRPDPRFTAPVRYRFDIPGPVPVQQDVLVRQDGFRIEPLSDSEADVTLRCNTGDYLLLVYGRLPLERAMDTGRLHLMGSREHAQRFTTLFQGV